MSLGLKSLVLKLSLIDSFISKVESVGFFLQEIVSPDAVNAHVVLDAFLDMVLILFFMKFSFVDGHAGGRGHFEFDFSGSAYLVHSD